MDLSRHLNHCLPAVWAVRANTAAGKSTAIANEPAFQSATSSAGTVEGALTPDYIKWHLRKVQHGPIFLVNDQVHDEGVALFKRLLKSLKNEATEASFVIEGRLSTVEELHKTVLSWNKKRAGEVLMMDIESALITSLYRVLTRDPFKSQCPPLTEIIKGYKESIIYLKSILEIVSKERTLVDFKLYYNDEHGQRHLIAEKKAEELKILSPQLLAAACRLPSEMEIEKMTKEIVSAESIDRAIQRGDIPAEMKSNLLLWEGISLAKAIDLHAMGLELTERRRHIEMELQMQKAYGPVEIQPFFGGWLSDYPELVEFLERERRLHVRGMDEKGQGLQWPTNTFAWKLNPKYHPEACVNGSSVPGFEMRLGYFIIPPDQADIYLAKGLSPEVLQELEMRDDKNQLVGYRFFVHPEGYAHFNPLHAAGIPFVQAQNSEFMGTSTSSYRSWVVRRIDKA